MHLAMPKRRFASVPFHVLLHMSWRNLISKKLRSLLTITGVTIGIGAIFFLFSLGLGLQDDVDLTDTSAISISSDIPGAEVSAVKVVLAAVA